MKKSPAKNTKAEFAALFAGGGDDTAKPMRLAKRMASAGLCSRRDAEKWIAAGRVAVNGAVQESPALNVSGADEVRVDGEALPAAVKTPRLYRYHKPRGEVVSARDEAGRKTVFDSLKAMRGLPRLVSIGRLDMDSEGLLLLTTSGALARHLELPQTGWRRKYRVRVRGRVDAKRLAALKDGITIDGMRYRGIAASIDNQAAGNAWLTMVITEGKNRELRRIMEHLGHPVSRLIRTSFGPFRLERLAAGEIAEVPVKTLREQLGV